MGLPFVALAGRARWAQIFLVVMIGVDLLTIRSDLQQITTINDFLGGARFDPGALSSSDDGQRLDSLLKLAALLGGGITFIRWFSAAYRNVTALAPGENRFKTGWAIGAWFVPILCMWRPKQIADDMWRIGERQPPRADAQPPRLAKTTTVLTLWWGLWLVAAFVGNFSARLLFGSGSLEDIRDSDKVDVAALIVDIAAAALAIVVIHRITVRLADTKAALAEPDAPAEPGFASL